MHIYVQNKTKSDSTFYFPWYVLYLFAFLHLAFFSYFLNQNFGCPTTDYLDVQNHFGHPKTMHKQTGVGGLILSFVKA